MLSAAVAWLAKSWITERLKHAIKSEYDQKLESHKAQLKAQSDVEIERLRSQLNITASEHQVQFSALHAKRATVITGLYDLLVEAHWAGGKFASPLTAVEDAHVPLAQKHWNAVMAIQNFFRSFDKQRIYLPFELCTSLDILATRMRAEIYAPSALVRYPAENLPQHVEEQRSRALERAWDYFDKEFPVARGALEREFRSLLGDRAASV